MRMSLILFALVTFIVLASEAQTYDKAELERRAAIWDAHHNYSNTEIQVLPPSTNFAKKIPLTIVILKNSFWGTSQVVERIRQTEDIYQQCEVSFSPIILVSTVHASGPIATVDGDGGRAYVDLNLMLMDNAVTKPVIFMVNNETEIHYGGRSSRKGRVGQYDPRINTGFVFYESSFGPLNNTAVTYPIPSTFKRAQVLAHELAHILFDQPHIPTERNLLSEPKLRTNNISKDQCARMYENGFVK